MKYKLPEISEYALARGDVGAGNILIVDDEGMIADIYAEYLRERGHSVTVTYGAREGLRELTGETDVVILDRRMGMISGDEFLEIINSRDIHEPEPSVFESDNLTGAFEEGQVTDLASDTLEKLDSETVAHLQGIEIDCRVCVVSAVDPDLDLLEMPLDDYITKATDERELVETVELLLAFDQLDDVFQRYWTKGRERFVIRDKLSRRKLKTDDRYNALIDEIERLEAEHEETLSAITE